MHHACVPALQGNHPFMYDPPFDFDTLFDNDTVSDTDLVAWVSHRRPMRHAHGGPRGLLGSVRAADSAWKRVWLDDTH